MQSQVSNVYDHNDKHRFVAACNGNRKGYEFLDKKEAIKARARIIKRLKKDGFKVYL